MNDTYMLFLYMVGCNGHNKAKVRKEIQELKNWPLDKIPDVFYVSVRHTTELVCKTDQSS